MPITEILLLLARKKDTKFLLAFISLIEACQKGYTTLRLYVRVYHFEYSLKLSLETSNYFRI